MSQEMMAGTLVLFAAIFGLLQFKQGQKINALFSFAVVALIPALVFEKTWIPAEIILWGVTGLVGFALILEGSKTEKIDCQKESNIS